MKKLISTVLATLLYMVSMAQNLPQLSFNLETASVNTDEKKLIVTTGKVKRVWELTNAGIVTVELKDLSNGLNHATKSNKFASDWSYYGFIDDQSKGNLSSLTAKQSTDDNFTSSHIEVIVEFEYPSIKSFVKYVIWAFPDAKGIRTQLFIKGDAKSILRGNRLQ